MSVHELSLGESGRGEIGGGSAWEEGYRQGFVDGHADARTPDCVRFQVMEALLQQLVDDKAALLEQLRMLGEQLAAHDAAFDAELKADMDCLRRRATMAEVELAALRQDLSSLDDSLVLRSRQYVSQSWLYNSCRVFMGATRKVLESLLREETEVSGRVRELFTRIYSEQVQRSLERGVIKTAPETSPEFAEAMPATRKFILDLLRAQRGK